MQCIILSRQTVAKFQKDRYKTVRGVALTRYHYKIVILKNDKVHKLKMTKIKVRIMSKPRAHSLTIMKTHPKFQKQIGL